MIRKVYFDLVVRVDSKPLLRKAVSAQPAKDGVWLQEEVDLSGFAGKEIKLELVNEPTGWSNEAAYWAAIELVSD